MLRKVAEKGGFRPIRLVYFMRELMVSAVWAGVCVISRFVTQLRRWGRAAKLHRRAAHTGKSGYSASCHT